MSERIIYNDQNVTLTETAVTAGAVSCALGDITGLRLKGGTGIEEKVFLSIIAFFGFGIALVGLLLQDRGELLLGLGLAAVTIWLVSQKCELVLLLGKTRLVLLRDRNVRYIRQIRNALEEAIEAAAEKAPGHETA